jgi:hypothetical protein
VGVEARLSEVYAPLTGATVVPPRDGAHFAVEVDAAAAAGAGAAAALPAASSPPPPTPLGELVRALAAMRRHAAEWPFLAAAQAVADGRGGATPALSFEARRGQATYVVPRGDKLVVAFALAAAEPTERALLRVVAQELAEAKVGGGSGGAPSVTFTDKAATADSLLPLELRGLAPPPPAPAAATGEPPAGTATASDGGDASSSSSSSLVVGYVIFTCFPRHVAPRAQAAATATALASFRHYLDYHVAATKGYLHGRMRARLDGWLEGLKAAARDDAVADAADGSGGDAKRVTVSGRAFVPKA